MTSMIIIIIHIIIITILIVVLTTFKKNLKWHWLPAAALIFNMIVWQLQAYADVRVNFIEKFTRIKE